MVSRVFENFSFCLFKSLIIIKLNFFKKTHNLSFTHYSENYFLKRSHLINIYLSAN